MPLRSVFHADRTRLGLHAASKEEVLAQMASLLCLDTPLDAEAVRRALWERERIASTAVGSGVAMPHGRLADAETVRGALGIYPSGAPFEAIDGEPVRIVVALVAPEDRPAEHLKTLARISRRLRRIEARTRLVKADSPRRALAALLGPDPSPLAS